MGFEADWARAVDAELGVTVQTDMTFRDEARPFRKVRDTVTGYELCFPLVEEKRPISYVAKDGPHTDMMAVAYRLDRRAVRPFTAQLAASRTRGGRMMSLQDAEDAVRDGVYALWAGPEKYTLRFVPDFEVTWIGPDLRYDARERAIVDDERKLVFERHPGESGALRIRDSLTGAALTVPRGGMPLREYAQVYSAFAARRTPAMPTVTGDILEDLRAAVAMLNTSEPLH